MVGCGGGGVYSFVVVVVDSFFFVFLVFSASVTDAWEAKDADDMLQAMKTLGIVDKKTFQQLRDRLRLGVDARNDMLDVLTDAMMVAKKAVMADASGKALNK